MELKDQPLLLLQQKCVEIDIEVEHWVDEFQDQNHRDVQQRMYKLEVSFLLIHEEFLYWCRNQVNHHCLTRRQDYHELTLD